MKKQTLKTYEAMLRQPEGLPVEVFKCKVCFKYFASDSYLISHYKKRHTDYYMSEIRKREDEQLEKELGEIDKHASEKLRNEAMLQRLKDELFEKYNCNFSELQQTLRTIKEQN